MRIAAVLCLAGCDLVFKLDSAPERCPIGPEANCTSGEHDEDDDDIADGCDPCPQVPGPDTDDDGDGIGNACDPQPAVPAICTERRFFGLADERGWEAPDDWLFDGSARTITSELRVLRSVEIRGRGRIEALIADASTVPGHVANDLVIGVTLLDDGANGYLCALHPDVDGALGTLILAKLEGDRERQLMETESFGQTPGASHVVQLAIAEDGTVTCVSRDLDGNVQREVLQLVDDALPAGGNFGLAIRGTLASFDYVDFVPE